MLPKYRSSCVAVNKWSKSLICKKNNGLYNIYILLLPYINIYTYIRKYFFSKIEENNIIVTFISFKKVLHSDR